MPLAARLRGADFDTVVFDDANQATLPVALMAMLSGRRYCFFGDSRHLPPVRTFLGVHSASAILEGRGCDSLLA